MRMVTLLNHCHKFKRFVYISARFEEQGKKEVVIADISPRRNSRPICSCCGHAGSIYDTSAVPRLFEFIPVWGYPVFFRYSMRRVDCHHCGRPIIEDVPWSSGKHHLADVYRCFLASWAKKMSWMDVARSFQTSWDKVFSSIKFVVGFGLANRSLDNVTALGIDEIQHGEGHKYLTLIYQIDHSCRRLLWIGKERKAKTLNNGLTELNEEHRRKQKIEGSDAPKTRSFLDQITVICSDIWKPYLKTIRERLSHTTHILDRFHIMLHFSKAIDKVRAEEARRLKQEGKDPVLSKSRWCFLKRKKNLKESEQTKLSDLLSMNLRTVKAYILKEDFQRFWEYTYAAWAGKYLDRWCFRTMRSKIEPMKDIAKMLRRHREPILNWFRAKKQFNNGIVEGLNLKWNLTVRKSFGFRTFNAMKIASFHQLGDLPEPEFTHRFY